MRTLLPSLSSLIAASGQQPSLSLIAQDLQARLSTVASGGPTGRSAAILSATGKIIRAIVPQTAAGNQSITVQTITPSSPSSWTQPGVVATANAVANAGCCLVQTGSTTRLFYQRTADNLICSRDSTNDGLTWGTETVVLSTTPLNLPYCYGIAADSITQIWVAFAQFDPYGVCGLYRSAFTTSWSAWHNEGPGTPAYGQVRGLNMVTVSGTRHFACGVGLRGYVSGISAGTFTWSGSSYSAMTAIQTLDNPTQGLTLAYPDLFYDPNDTSGQPWYAIVTMTDDGSVSTSAHTRTTLYRSPDGQSWHPSLATGTAFAWGAHVIVTGGQTYLFDAATCYTIAALPSPTDLSADVLAIDITDTPDVPSRATITLDNSQGQYTGAAWLIDNATLTLALGYSGQTVTTHSLYLDGWSLTAEAPGRQLVLTASDALKLLDVPSTLLLSYSGQTLGQLVSAVCTQGGAGLATLPGTSQFSQVVPCLTVLPGQSWLQILQRLATLYGFQFHVDAAGTVTVLEPQAGDPSTWSYGAEILAVSLSQAVNRPNVVRVAGAGTSTASVWSEVADQANLLLVGKERYLLTIDRLLDTSAKCQIRASLELRRIQRQAQGGELLVALNPQHELGDVITLSDAGAGAANQAMRIAAIRWVMDGQDGSWHQELTLEGV